jgi:proton-coupled amino acid transporter
MCSLSLCSIPMDILMRKLENRIAKKRNVSEIAIRTGIMIAMGGVAIAVPDLEPVIR